MTIREARAGDAAGIAAVHVAAWRSAYAGLLPAAYLAGLDDGRHRRQHGAAIAAGHGVLVAEEAGRVVGFCTAGRARRAGLGDGEVETLYVHDDWRERGLGRGLLQGAAARLQGEGCRSVFLWVLQDNPSRWFYERMGGRAVSTSSTRVGGQAFVQVAYAWDPVRLLLP